MKKLSLFALTLVIALITGVTVVAAQPSNFRTHLTGAEEVPAVETKAQGQAIFQLNSSGDVLRFKLIVANIENVTMAHIHCAAAGANGPVALWLYPNAGPPQLIPGPFNGVLAEGTRTTSNIIPIPEDSAVCPGGIANLDELMDRIRSGHAYVNVHTSQYPGGEIRGQIR